MALPRFKQSDINGIRSRVERAQRIVITCHKAPDGDAIGSCLALMSLFRRMGKVADVVTPDMPLRALMFAPGANQIIVNSVNEKAARQLLQKADLIFCLDFNSLHRVDKMAEALAQAPAFKVMVDHHIGPEQFCDITFSEPERSSTCELLYHVIGALGYHRFISREVAQCLFLGMMTDTGNFTYGSEDPEIYIVVADLLSYDIDKAYIYNMALNTFSADSLRLRGYALNSKMEIYPEKGVAAIFLSQEELDEYRYKKGDLEGLVNKPLCIPEVTMSFMFREDSTAGLIKVSTRSQGDRSVEEICREHFGGGGHKNASGGDFHGTLDEAKAEFLKILSNL